MFKNRSWNPTRVARVGVVAWLCVISFDVGCTARCAGDMVEKGYRSKQILNFVYHKTPREAFDGAQKLLARSGLVLADVKSVAARTYTTAWQEKKEFDAVVKRACSVKITKVRKGVKVRIVRLEQRQADSGPVLDRNRARDLEWSLIQQLEPGRAQAIDLLAQAHRQQAEDRAEGCGCPVGCPAPAGCSPGGCHCAAAPLR